MKTLLIDNEDSFTYNLFHLLAEVNGEAPIVVQHHAWTWAELDGLYFDNIVLSPGPGHPARSSDFGICWDILENSLLPILGVCLGHQGMCAVLGGRVVPAPCPMHGRLSEVVHESDPLYEAIPHRFQVMRYHSLMVASPLPSALKVIARTSDDVVMGLRHRTRPWWGVQYHPESICGTYGLQLLKNFKTLTAAWQCEHPLLYARQLQKKRVTAFSISTSAKSKTLKRGLDPADKPRDVGVESEREQLQERLIYPTQPQLPIPASPYHLHVRQCPIAIDPETVFAALFKDQPYAVWLDSVSGHASQGRFSWMGDLTGPHAYRVVYEVTTDVTTLIKGETITSTALGLFDYLQQALAVTCDTSELPFPFVGGFVGYLGYELYAKTMDLPSVPHAHPTAQFLFLDRCLVFDHETQHYYVVALSRAKTEPWVDPWFEEIVRQLQTLQVKPEPDIAYTTPLQQGVLRADRRTYLKQIEQCFSEIAQGESYEMCLTNRLTYQQSIDPFSYYQRLRRINPAPYASFSKWGDLALASASIERFLHVNVTGQVESQPIKGTLPRGQTIEQDEILKQQLSTDEMFRAEHVMIVDLLRHDLGQVCQCSSVHVPSLMRVETYATVHQLVSTVRGQLSPGKHALDALQAAFPPGSMTGAPKRRTITLLQALEQAERGIYAGALGYLSLNGCADFAVVMRTAVITPDAVTIGTGGAITALSSPEVEFDEMLLKARAMQAAL